MVYGKTKRGQSQSPVLLNFLENVGATNDRTTRELPVALQSNAVSSLVTSHLVNGVVDGIQAVLLGADGQIELALGCAVLAVRESVRSGHFFTPKSAVPIFCAIGKNAPNDATVWR